MPVTRIIMMQKNEGDMLLKWIAHYASIFGPENVTIMDNGSDDSITISTLALAESCGIQVIWGYNTSHDFLCKGGHFKNIIESWDNDLKYDFAIPVDCDEFIGVFKESRVSLAKDDIVQELQSLIGTKSALRLDMSLFNVPGKPGWFSPDRSFHKGFLSAGTIANMDNGHHAPTSRVAPGFRGTRLTYLHYHNRRFSEFRRLSAIKLGFRIEGEMTTEVLKRYNEIPERPGSHLVKNLLIDESEYNSMYDHEMQIYIPGAEKGGTKSETCFLLGGQTHVWDPEKYLRANPDVRSYEPGPLHHYVRCGWLEKRKLSYE